MNPMEEDIMKQFSERYRHEEVDDLNHHKDTDTYKEWFIKNVENLVLSFESNVNQFKVKGERLLNTPQLIRLWPEGLQNRLKMPDHPYQNNF